MLEPTTDETTAPATVAPVLIAGEEVPSDFAPVLNPARTDEIVGEYALGTAHHVDLAVAAAIAAFGRWSALTAGERAEYLLRAADRIEVGLAARAVLLTREQGKVLWESRLDVGGAPMMLRYFASLAAETDRLGEAAAATSRGNAVLRHVPVGPVGIITPWNTPVYLAFGALAPALLAGNTVVVKLPEEAPARPQRHAAPARRGTAARRRVGKVFVGDFGRDARTRRARAPEEAQAERISGRRRAPSPISACTACANSPPSSIRRTRPFWPSARRAARRSRPRTAA